MAKDRLYAEIEALRTGDNVHPLKPKLAADDKLAAYLSAEAWMVRSFPDVVHLLGDIITSTSRTFLVGSTGLGKTMLGVAMAAAMATGTEFLGWACERPARVLYVDGEMPGELVKQRVRDAARRLGRGDLMANLFIYCADSAEMLARQFPELGAMDPLNTEAGQAFVLALIEVLGGVDVVIFDNVMSLVAGDQKDEVPWSETLPLVAALTRQNVGQVWLDHTGHNTDRQYGSSTKAWRFDTVGIMTELPDDQRNARETAFTLSFDHPGKSRRRTPDNWQQFAPCTIRLVDDSWTHDRVHAIPPKKVLLNKEQMGWLKDLQDYFSDPREAHRLMRPDAEMPVLLCATRDEIRGWMVRRGRVSVASDGVMSATERSRLSRGINALKDRGKLSINGDWVWLL